MATVFTSNLRLALPTTGAESGTWGTTVNDGITTLVDTAITGLASLSMTTADYTLSTANGATDEARCMFLTIGGTPGAARSIIVPALSKLYIVYNNSTGGYAQTVKTSAGTGISVPNGSRAVLYCDGTNVVTAATYASAMTLGTALPVASGGTGASTLTANYVLLGNGTSAPQMIAPSTAKNVLMSDGTTWASTSVQGTALTWTAAQTFTNSLLKLLGSSTGVTTFASANAGASNYTITFPAATATVATLDGTQTLTNKTITYADNTLTGVQATLVSGTNIKTVNSTSLVGSGNVLVGAAGSTAVTGSTTLTASSDGLQIVTPNGYGQAVTLPAANTLQEGVNLYAIKNASAKYQLGIRSGGATLRDVIAPGGMCLCSLKDSSTVDGGWEFVNDASDGALQTTYDTTRSATYTNEPAGNAVTCGGYILTSGLVGTNAYLQAVDRATGQVGSAVLLSASNSGTVRLAAMSATTALVCWYDPGGYVFNVRLATLSGTNTVTLGTEVTLTPAGATSGPAFSSMGSLSATQGYIYIIWEASGTYKYASWGVNVSGTTVSVSATPLTIISGGVPISGAARSIVAINTTQLLLVSWDGSTTTAVNVITYSGAATPTAGATASVVAASGGQAPLLLSANKWIWAYGTETIGTITVSGTAVTINAGFNCGTAAIPRLELYSASRIVFTYGSTYGVVQESANVISSAVAIVTYTSLLGTYAGSLSGAYLNFYQTNGLNRLLFDGNATITLEGSIPAGRYSTVGSARIATVGTTEVFYGNGFLKNGVLTPLKYANFEAVSTIFASGNFFTCFPRVPPLNNYACAVFEVAQ